MISMFNFLPAILKLGGKLIVDKDKQAEYAFKVLEMGDRFAQKMLETKTYPWIDGLVKLAYAGEMIVKGLIRPVAAGCMFGFAVYCEIELIELSEGVELLLYSGLPAWGVSRHQEKKRKKKEEEDDYDF